MAGNLQQQQQALSKPPSGKHGNVLPLWGNEKTMNLNPMILTNVLSSPYFKVQLYELKTYHEVVDEIYFKVTHVEPWEKGSRKTAGQTGMCGGVRGVGTGGIVSTAFCLLYKLFTLKLTRKQVMGLITHTDSPYIRALGFMYIRYTQPPADLIEWFEPFLDDEEELDVKAGGGCVMTVGEMLRSFLTKLEWFSTLFPRIPVPVQKTIDQQMKNRPRKPPQKQGKEDEEDGDWHRLRSPRRTPSPRKSPNRSRSRSHHRERRGASFDRELQRERDRQRKDRDRERDKVERDRVADRGRDQERDRRHSRTPDRASERRKTREQRKERDGDSERERSRRKEREHKERTSGGERNRERSKDKRAKGEADERRHKDEREERRHREERKSKRSSQSRSRERRHKGEHSSRKGSRSRSRSRQEPEEKSRKRESSHSKEHMHKRSHSQERSHRRDASNGKDHMRTDIEVTP
ncbi:pre-mRNA-splicing factor 38B isoform X2 [Neoarius graeffei]|uniref:pre-mRNA-splicing factor 38B isoform X2 n=1 Tax=Neoarius graeffei TaxID=443677 RepID=UPI00298C4B8B|nr:pre-mRNA-splicing factor 38B isoform X2 [Neoarius graeffei]